MNTKANKDPSKVTAQVERPVRPECWKFAMDFLGEPENKHIEQYVLALEVWADSIANSHLHFRDN